MFAYTPAVVLSPAAYSRRLAAARRRVQVARARADRNPTPTPANQEAAAELEAGLARLEQQGVTA